MALVGAGVSSVDSALQEMETETAALDEKLQEMAKNMNWEVVKDEEFQSPGTAFCKKHVSQIEKIMFNHPPLKKKKKTYTN